MKIKQKSDFIILKGLYEYRSLTLNQIKLYLSLNDVSVNNLQDVINKLLNRELIDMVNFDFDNYAFILNVNGFKYIAENDEVLFDNKIVNKKITFSKYRLKENLLNHQLHLNNVMLKTMENLKSQKFSRIDALNYFDEKNFLNNVDIPLRPDGTIFQKSSDGRVILYFLEIDMDTESVHQLSLKWDNYYKLSKYFFKEHNNIEICMLFIAPSKKRLDVTKATLINRMELIKNPNLSFYLTKFENCNQLLTNLITSENKNNYDTFKFSNLEVFKDVEIRGYKIKNSVFIPIFTSDDENALNSFSIVKKSFSKKYNVLFLLKKKIEDIDMYDINQIIEEYSLKEDLIKIKENCYFSSIDDLKNGEIMKVENFSSMEAKIIKII